MPSPGDSFLRLSGDLFRRVRNPVAAYDAAGGLNDNGRPSAETIEKIMTFLKGKLSDADLEVFRVLLDDPGAAMDSPVDFPGKPTVGGGQVPLGADESFARDWPGAARIRLAW
jgi:hypothetical protein